MQQPKKKNIEKEPEENGKQKKTPIICQRNQSNHVIELLHPLPTPATIFIAKPAYKINKITKKVLENADYWIPCTRLKYFFISDQLKEVLKLD